MPYTPDSLKLQPHPTTDEYIAAYEILDESFGTEGAWINVMRSADVAANSPQQTGLRNEIIAFGKFLRGEELAEDEAIFDDFEKEKEKLLEKSRIGIAFYQGFRQQLDAVQLLNSHSIVLEDALKILRQHHVGRNIEQTTDESVNEMLKSRFLMSVGRHGLSLVGLKASSFIDKWAHDVYVDERKLQKAFSLGHGAMIVCGADYQKVINDMIIEKWGQEGELDRELGLLLGVDTNGAS